MFTKLQNKKGFSLIELMIVVAIIGILAAIAIPQLAGFRARAVRATMISDARGAYSVVLSRHIDTATHAGLVAGPLVGPSTTLEIDAVGAPFYYTSVSNGNSLGFVVGAVPETDFSLSVTNLNGNDATFTGPVTMDQTGACTWVASPIAGNRC